MIDHLTIQAVEDAFNCGYPRDADAALLIELDGLAVGMDVQAEHIVAACRNRGARVRTGGPRRSGSFSGRDANPPSAPTAACRQPTW